MEGVALRLFVGKVTVSKLSESKYKQTCYLLFLVIMARQHIDITKGSKAKDKPRIE